MPKIIQFLHTSVEATPENPNESVIEWNNNKDHRRKFILSKGKFIKENHESDADLTFWGEWEAQSKIERTNSSKDGYPKYLNYPFINPSVPNRTHNTDPYVFGENFRYIVCKQGYSVILRNLEPYSLILFGSRIRNKFCLDTVFVVSKEIIKYTVENIDILFKERNAYYYASVNPLYDDTKYNKFVDKEDTCRIDIGKEYSLYKGVNFKEKNSYDGIYSFVPCKEFNSKNKSTSIFIQPELDLDLISDNQSQGINACNDRDFTEKEIKDYWLEVKNQLVNKNFLLGTYFDTPKLIK